MAILRSFLVYEGKSIALCVSAHRLDAVVRRRAGARCEGGLLMKKLLNVALILSLAACSGAKSKAIPADPAKWEELAEDAKSLPDDERRMLGAYLVRMGMGAALNNSKVAVPPGTTIGDAIEAQTKFEADQKQAEAEAVAVKAKADAERAQRAAQLSKAATVVMTDMSVLPKNYDVGRYSERLDFTYAVMNKTDKAISGIKGVTVFTDQFGTEITKMNLSMDEDVPAKATRTIAGYGKDINQFDDDDRKLSNTPFSKMKVTFVTEMIVFADGTKLGSESEQ